jgi:hypothetical protein
MRPVTDRMVDQECTLTLQTWGSDLDGGRMPVGATIRRNVPCVYLPGKGKREVEDRPEMGLRRVTQVIPTSFGFTENVGLNIDDLVAWTDEGGMTHNYQVKSYGPYVAGQTGWHVATVEEIT